MVMTILKKIKKYPFISSMLISLVLGFIASVLYCVLINWDYVYANDIAAMFVFVGVFLVYPAILSVINFVSIFVIPKDNSIRRKLKKFEYITFILGFVYSLGYISVSNIVIFGEWDKQLVNFEIHQPVWSGAMTTVIALGIIGFVGYLILSFVRIDKMPPLIVVLAISAMYLGIFECVMSILQTIEGEHWLLGLFPANCILIAVKLIRTKIMEWNQMEQHEIDSYPEKKVLNTFNNVMRKAEYWPVLAFVLMWPLLGVVLCILILFGQKPDYIIKAWTETAEWGLSEQTAPQNLYIDEHYLCTVAAGGHASIVKPIRMGERHGHPVIVNRQLCIANAFEQILEDRTPGFHRIVRHVYDTYGFPIAKLIRTKKAADVVYYIMKPLEWIFLFVIYLCDVKPENRIAVQYLPMKKQDKI